MLKVLEEKHPEKPDDEWMRCERIAKGKIIEYLTDSMLGFTTEMDTALDIIKKLVAIYERKSLATELAIEKKLLSFKFKEDMPLVKHFILFDEMIVELEAASDKMKEMSKVARLLLTLPNSYDTVVTAIQTQSDERLTLAFVKIKLLDYEIKLRGEQSETSAKVLQSETKSDNDKIKKKKGFRVNFNKKQYNQQKHVFKNKRLYKNTNQKCDHCGRRNHEKKDCFNYKKSYAAEDRQRTIQTVQMQDENRGFVFMTGVQALKRKESNDSTKINFIHDSGATDHLVKESDVFMTLSTLEKPIKISVAKKGEEIIATKIGSIQVITNLGITGVLKNVLYAPEVSYNLLSVRRMQEAGMSVIFGETGGVLIKRGDKSILTGSTPDLLPALLLIHGDSYSWSAGNAFDGTALAAYGRLIVVSINFRLGVLGFLKTGPKGSAQGNYGLMDLVAGLHWLHENLGAFGGDPNRLTLFGHGTGAALANFLAASPMAKELVERVVLLGGSALSPWAIQRDPLTVKSRVADQTGCPDDVEVDDIAPCLRLRSLEELLAVQLDPPRFTSGFAPFMDGAVMPQPVNQNFQPTASSSGLMPLMPGPGTEFASFGDRDLLLGLTSEEAWVNLTDDDIQNGLNETRRDRILRTYVRNTYRYHLHEIYSTLRNEYTDWERGEQSPTAICEGLLALLGDGQVAAPLLKLALLHSAAGGRGYFLHFQLGNRPSQKGEEIPYLLGIPLLRGEVVSVLFASINYTSVDENLSKLLVHYLANFVKRGDPNGASPLTTGSDGLPTSPPFWDSYDSINQLYLEAGRSTEMRSHYRGHKMSLWLNLLPQLHRPGYEISMRHHHLAESPSLYEGAVRPQTLALPLPAPPLPMPSPTEPSSVTSLISTTECTPNATVATTVATTTRTLQHSNLGPGPNNLLRKLASSHYQSYTTALTVTIAVGVFLLLLNILIFAGIYHQRDRNASNAAGLSSFGDKKKEELLEAGCSGIEMSSGKQRLSTLNLMDSPSSSPPPHKAKLAQELELQLQEFQCSPPPGGGKRILEPPLYTMSPCAQRTRTPSPCVDATTARMDDDNDDDPDSSDEDNDDDNLPEPPPPPKVPAPNVGLSCPGILRQPGTPGSAKKRVQIQEISV